MYPQISKTELFILVTAILFEYKVENELLAMNQRFSAQTFHFQCFSSSS